MARPTDIGVPRDRVVPVRLSQQERAALDAQRAFRGASDNSSYVRGLIAADGAQIETERERKRRRK